MTNHKGIIMLIGDWGNPPHHAFPRVRRKKPPKVIGKNKSIQPIEQLEIDCTQTQQRLCKCGELLEFRQRYCDKCKVRHRKESNRKAQRKHTKKKRSNISS